MLTPVESSILRNLLEYELVYPIDYPLARGKVLSLTFCQKNLKPAIAHIRSELESLDVHLRRAERTGRQEYGPLRIPKGATIDVLAASELAARGWDLLHKGVATEHIDKRAQLALQLDPH